MRKVKVTLVREIPEPGERFKFKGLDFIALGMEQGGLLTIADKSIGDMPFDESSRNDWRISTLREYLNGELLDKIGRNGLLTFSSDLTADDGMKDYGSAEDYVFLLSCDLYRKYRKHIPKYKDWWWTITPWSCVPSYGGSERLVLTTGALGSHHANIAYGVVPCLLFNLSSFCKPGDETPDGELMEALQMGIAALEKYTPIPGATGAENEKRG